MLWLWIQIGTSDSVISSVKSYIDFIAEKPPHQTNTLIHHISTVCLDLSGPQDFELIPAHTKTQANKKPTVAEMIDRRDLLGQDYRIPKWS